MRQLIAGVVLGFVLSAILSEDATLVKLGFYGEQEARA